MNEIDPRTDAYHRAENHHPELLHLYADYQPEYAADRSEDFAYAVMRTICTQGPYIALAALSAWGLIILVLGVGGPDQ